MKLHLGALAALGLLIGVQSGHAAEFSSTWQYQTPAGKWDVQPGFSYWSREITMRNATKSKVTSFDPWVTGEYGINENYSVGGKLLYGMTNQTTDGSSATTKTTGLDEPMFYFNAKHAIGGGTLYWGADLTLGLQKGKNSTAANGDVTVNRSEGETSLAMNVGYETNIDAGWLLGAGLNFDLLKGNRVIATDTATVASYDATYKAGNAFDIHAYTEYAMAPMALGFGLTYKSIAAQKLTTSTTSTETDLKDVNTNLTMSFYLPYQIAEGMVFQPGFDYTTTTWSDSANVVGLDKATSWNLYAGLLLTY